MSMYGMTKDDKYFYVCSASGMRSGIIKVLEMPGFKLRRDLAGDRAIDSCGPYNQASDSFGYSLYDVKTGTYIPYVYDIYADEVKSL